MTSPIRPGTIPLVRRPTFAITWWSADIRVTNYMPRPRVAGPKNRSVVCREERPDGRHVRLPLLPERHVRRLLQGHLLGSWDPVDERLLERRRRLVAAAADRERRHVDLAEP